MELPRKFKNRPNGRLRLNYQFNGNHTELDYWIHRSPALVGVVFAITGEGTVNVLITKRSAKMRDEANKLCVPCGYLDWDETMYEGMMREVYEESSLYLPDYKKYLMFNNNEQPFRVKDKPEEDKRQNVSHLYVSVYDFRDNMDKFPIGIEQFTCKETAWVLWMKYADFIDTHKNHKWAFDHDETIKSALQFFNKNFNDIRS